MVGDFASKLVRLCGLLYGVTHVTRQSGRRLRLFALSAGVLLLVTGVAKIVSALGNSAVLARPDPILGIHFNHLLMSVGVVEFAVAILCLGRTTQKLALGLIAALSINFLSYRVGLWISDWPGYCPCLGTLTQALHLSARHADLLTLLMLVYLMLGSFWFLACTWRGHERQRKSASSASTLTVISGYSDQHG